MKITKKSAKALIENLIYTDESNKLSKENILINFKPFVELSRRLNEDLTHVYRVLKLQENAELKPFRNNECTTKSLRVVCNIAANMPSFVFGKDKMLEFNSHYFCFKVPRENIFLDIEKILPYIKEILKDNMEDKFRDKDYRLISIKQAIELIEDADEKEIIADLSNLHYQKIMTTHYRIDNIMSIGLNQINNKLNDISSEEDFKSHYENIFKKITSKEDHILINSFLIRNNPKNKTNKLKSF